LDIPLFPLRTVLCPGIALPLHVFEPRYRLLTERCVADSTPFGIVLIREGREVGTSDVSIAAVGTFAEIREVGQYPDGRFDLLVVGAGRFSIDRVHDDREPYLVATVTPLDDEPGDPAITTAVSARTMRRFVSYLQLLQPVDGESAEDIDVRVEIETEPATPSAADDPDEPGSALGAEPELTEPSNRAAELDAAARRLVIPEDPTVLSYLLSGIIQVDPGQRQVLLEAPTTLDRLELLDQLITRELWLLRRRLRHYVPDDEHAAVRRN
jgi:Lon protease-like protein